MQWMRLMWLTVVLAGVDLSSPLSASSASTVDVVPERPGRGPWAGVHYRAAPQEMDHVVLGDGRRRDYRRER